MMGRLTGLASLALLCSAMAALPVGLSAHGSSSSASSTGFSEALNDYRAQHGVGALVADPDLATAAQDYADDLASQDYFSHTGRNGSNAMVRASAAGCAWSSVGENLAKGYTSIGQVIDGWDGSGSHRRTMLGSRYGRYGLGRAGTLWVLIVADRC